VGQGEGRLEKDLALMGKLEREWGGRGETRRKE